MKKITIIVFLLFIALCAIAQQIQRISPEEVEKAGFNKAIASPIPSEIVEPIPDSLDSNNSSDKQSLENYIVEFNLVDTKPKIIHTTLPEYPDSARRMGLEGRVIVSFVIDTNGQVLPESFEIIGAQPEGIFEEAAKKAVYDWKFSPGQSGDRKVRVRWTQPISFDLGINESDEEK